MVFVEKFDCTVTTTTKTARSEHENRQQVAEEFSEVDLHGEMSE